MSELLKEATIQEIDQDGGELDCYGIDEAEPEIREKANKLIRDFLDKIKCGLCNKLVPFEATLDVSHPLVGREATVCFSCYDAIDSCDYESDEIAGPNDYEEYLLGDK